MLTLLLILLFAVVKLRPLLLLYFPVHVFMFLLSHWFFPLLWNIKLVAFLVLYFDVICCMILISSDLTVINPGDEVIIFDPSFDTYENVISIAGGVPVSYRVVVHPQISKIDSSDCSNWFPSWFWTQNEQVYVTLDPPMWSLDPDKLLKSFTHRTKAIVLNRYEFHSIITCILFVLSLLAEQKFTSSLFWRMWLVLDIYEMEE